MAFFDKPNPAKKPQEELEAVLQTSAVIWFSPECEILDCNENFCAAMGYGRDEIVGKKHAMFVDPQYAASSEYQGFWARLRDGEVFSGTFPRVAEGGRVVWIEASYVPVKDGAGKVAKIVKFATDVTKRIEEAAEEHSRLKALDLSQATIEFETDGTILTANENFLAAVGYTLDEIRGQHHKLFVAEADRQSAEYQDFWSDLARGEAKSGEFRRFGKGGREIWLQATYNPIMNAAGKPAKVVKFASDITRQKQTALDLQGQIEALGRSQAVIEFEPDGMIRTANQNFLDALGYQHSEITGKHHSMFLAPEEAKSPSYAAFWENLRAGEFQQAEFRRFAKGGREIWIQATYNPIKDADGRVYKVVKFAVDITPMKHAIIGFQQAMCRLAENDLSVCLTAEVPPEFSELKTAFNTSVKALGSVIQGISGRSELILNEVTNIAGAAIELSARTEKQAAALEETSAAMEEMTASVTEAAKAADEANKTSAAAKERTVAGQDKVQESINAMKTIAESSEKISKISNLINDIAFQTNLLALNAGVEAARAGESGRGFAVVASEVRELAQRSADAAKEITGLIDQTSEQVRNGVKLVNESGAELEEIAGYAEDIRTQVSNLATSSREQSIGLDEINSAMTQIDQATQQNAAMFEETTAAAKSLEQEANALDDSTKIFSFAGQQNHFGSGGSKRQSPSAESSRVVQADFKRQSNPEAEAGSAPVQKKKAAVGGFDLDLCDDETETGGWHDF